MVGLPARGKSYLAGRICQYLNWLGHQAKVFNVGQYRRATVGSKVAPEFFDESNKEVAAMRNGLAMDVLEVLLGWIDQGGEVGIYDATNSTVERRNEIAKRVEAHGIELVFLESICDYDEQIEENIRNTKLRSPDYAGVDPEEAVRDFRKRIEVYKRSHQPVAEAERSYIKLINLGEKVVANRLRGYLPSRILYYLLNLHTTPRDIYLTRHGESVFNIENRIGKDPPLSERGLQYARALARFFEGRPVKIYTSTLNRTTQTATFVSSGDPSALSALDEIDAGLCEGLTYDEIAARFPSEAAARHKDKLGYRYPQGESYLDVIGRLEPAIIEIERQTSDVLVIGHQAINRALYGYFLGKPREEIPHLDMPLHTVVRLRPDGFGWIEERFLLL